MDGYWGVILLGVFAFIATMVDEIFILLALFLDPKISYRKVVLGQYIGVTIILLISGLSYFFKFLIPEGWIGLLGVIPIYYGISELINHYKKKKEDEKIVNLKDYEIVTLKEIEEIQLKEINFKQFFKSNSKILFVTFIAVSNGMDSVGVYAPLFVSMTWFQMVVLDVIFLILTGITVVLPYYIVRNPVVGKVIRKFGYNLNPYILIFLGLVIFYENETLETILEIIKNYF